MEYYQTQSPFYCIFAACCHGCDGIQVRFGSGGSDMSRSSRDCCLCLQLLQCDFRGQPRHRIACSISFWVTVALGRRARPDFGLDSMPCAAVAAVFAFVARSRTATRPLSGFYKAATGGENLSFQLWLSSNHSSLTCSISNPGRLVQSRSKAILKIPPSHPRFAHNHEHQIGHSGISSFEFDC